MNNTISLRVSKEEMQLIKEYANVNEINLSKFIRDLVIDAIEDDLKLDEERILKAKEKIKTEKAYDVEDVFKELGV